VSIDNGIYNVAKTGNRIIQPTETTTYILSASDNKKTIMATTQIIVNNNEEESSDEVPNLQFVKDSINTKLTVASADPGNFLWSDFEIIGSCDTSNLGSTVYAGDYFSSCSGTISIRHITTNTLKGTWDFN